MVETTQGPRIVLETIDVVPDSQGSLAFRGRKPSRWLVLPSFPVPGCRHLNISEFPREFPRVPSPQNYSVAGAAVIALTWIIYSRVDFPAGYGILK